MEHPAFTLAALCAFGGTMGFARTGSIPSLVAGVGIGAMYGYSGYLLKKNANYGIELAILASLVLGGAMIPRAIKTRKPLPIAMSVLAITGGAYYIKK
ncbi:hypothetical protein TWF569_009493 [Orbilia oligospora]|nr:hypothetical protein TWF103_002935 [Orbilia oligospora]KAF3127140.1 hypothetical protein TWF703_010088 [Orbilia oligospora]KAF3136508.1 hypothetical protein TWF569_009493 [Orbilia oligospora]